MATGFFLPIMAAALTTMVGLKLTGTTLFDIQYLLFTKVPWLARIYQNRQFNTVKNLGPHTSGDGLKLILKHAEIQTIPYGSDNYGYLIIDRKSKQACIIDAGDGETMIKTIKEQDPPIHLTHILSTHKHADHCSGNLMVKSTFPQIEIVGGKQESWPGVDGATVTVANDNIISVGSLQFRTFHVPSHTLGSVAYLLLGQTANEDMNCFFSGDFIFSGGAGRFFEGGAKDFLRSVQSSVLNSNVIPSENTLLFDGHEYTVANLKFALKIDPNHIPSQQRLKDAMEKRAQKQPTTPIRLDLERKTNIFLRVAEGLDSPLNIRIASLIEKNQPPVTVGSERKEYPVVKNVMKDDCEGLLRGLRALKDLPGDKLQV
jgi:hydroxyacylglutathione hydrolase